MASSAERAVEKDVNIGVSYQLLVEVVPVVVPVVAPTRGSRSLRMADISVPIFMDCSSVWNCASWVRNWVPSAGFNGSWFWIWATRSCRNSSLETVVLAADVVVPDELELAVAGSFCEIAAIISSPLCAVDFARDHLVYHLLRVTVAVKPGYQPGVNQLAVRHLDHEIRLILDRKSTRLNSSHRCISYAVFCLKKKK